MALSNLASAYANQAVNGMLAATAPSAPGTLYLGINNPSTGASVGASEITSYSGTRPAITFAAASAGNLYLSSTSTVTFTLTANITSGTAGYFYFSIWTAASGGTCICQGATNLTGTINSGNAITFSGTSSSTAGIIISVQG